MQIGCKFCIDPPNFYKFCTYTREMKFNNLFLTHILVECTLCNCTPTYLLLYVMLSCLLNQWFDCFH